MNKKLKFKDVEKNQGYNLDLPPEKEITIRLSSYGILINKEKIFLVKSGRTKKWELPGGGVDKGESLSEAVLRETNEESGYNVKLVSNLPVYTDIDFYYFKGKDKYFQNFIFVFRLNLINSRRNDLRLDEEGEILDGKWFNLSEVEKIEIGDFHKPIIENIKVYL